MVQYVVGEWKDAGIYGLFFMIAFSTYDLMEAYEIADTYNEEEGHNDYVVEEYATVKEFI